MHTPRGNWPSAVMDLVQTKVLQGFMYSGNLLCQAAAAIVQNATQDRVTVKMLKTFEEKLEFYFPVVVS